MGLDGSALAEPSKLWELVAQRLEQRLITLASGRRFLSVSERFLYLGRVAQW